MEGRKEELRVEPVRFSFAKKAKGGVSAEKAEDEPQPLYLRTNGILHEQRNNHSNLTLKVIELLSLLLVVRGDQRIQPLIFF